MAVDTGHETPVAALARRLDTATLARRMVTEFSTAIPAYGRLPDPDTAGGILEMARRNVDLFVECVVADRSPTREELEPFCRSARQRASEGMPLEDLLAAYRMGGRLGWRELCATAVADDRDALVEMAERTMHYVDRVSAAVAQSYLDARQHHVSEEERRLRDLFDALVAGAPLSASVRGLADRMGFPLDGSYRPFALVVPGAAAHEHAAIATSLRGRGVLALTEGERVTGLAPQTAQAGDLAGDEAILALGDVVSGPALAVELEDSRLLVAVGRRLERRGELRPDDFLPELLLARSSGIADRISQRVFAPLDAYEERRTSALADTLERFVAGGLDRRGAAAELGVHPNTLDYRLRRIGELTGLDLGHPRDVALVVLACRHRRLLATGL
jgi:hypothetical protein